MLIVSMDLYEPRSQVNKNAFYLFTDEVAVNYKLEIHIFLKNSKSTI